VDKLVHDPICDNIKEDIAIKDIISNKEELANGTNIQLKASKQVIQFWKEHLLSLDKYLKGAGCALLGIFIFKMSLMKKIPKVH